MVDFQYLIGNLLFILQTAVSFAPDCSLCSLSGLLFPDAWIILSSAYKSARQWFRWRGRSLKILVHITNVTRFFFGVKLSVSSMHA